MASLSVDAKQRSRIRPVRRSILPMHVLLVEDDDRVAAALQNILGRHGFTLTRAAGVETAWTHVTGGGIELVLLDLMLADGDGLALCARIRSVSDVPILITTAKGELVWRLHGLNLGADDYLVKPYDVRELMARMHALVRRARHDADVDGPTNIGRRVVVGELTIELDRRQVLVNGTSVSLTRKEFDILEELAATPGLVVRREQLLSKVWHSVYEPDGRTLNVHMAAVRAKLGVPDLIETVRGVGYRLVGA